MATGSVGSNAIMVIFRFERVLPGLITDPLSTSDREEFKKKYTFDR